MNTWGENIKISIFGESHGNGIGVVIDGIPSGTVIDDSFILNEMQRRAPGKNLISTPRKESDTVEILSGVVNGKTSGTPICGIIKNTNTISKDYQPEMIRPGHADFTGFCRYGENHDYRGGGHFSGRLTAPLVFAGALAKIVLKSQGISVGAHIKQVDNIYDDSFDSVKLTATDLLRAGQKNFPVLNDVQGEKMQALIMQARENQNSVGGVVECGIIGMPKGLGSPFFGSVESRLSSMMFSVPAVKGIEFGAGFSFAKMSGKEANDEFYTDGNAVKTYTNHNAGINGGISNGMPIIFRCVIKPTPSIALPQQTVDIKKMKNATHVIKGRHDPCIVHRANVVIESAAAITILDMLQDGRRV